eukprot:2647634-Pyramimonas_sp.AAC.1
MHVGRYCIVHAREDCWRSSEAERDAQRFGGCLNYPCNGLRVGAQGMRSSSMLKLRLVVEAGQSGSVFTTDSAAHKCKTTPSLGSKPGT